MKTKLYPWLILLLLGSLTARAQTPLTLTPQPLAADPVRAASAEKTSRPAQRGTALTLPFFDDFTRPLDGLPDATRWQAAGPGYPDGSGNSVNYLGGGAYVSNRLAAQPPTRGAATLDGLRGGGLPYSPTSPSQFGPTDTLTSQAIDLSRFGAGSGVFLSYAWQAGTLAGPPVASSGATPVSLTLEFLDALGLWNPVWTFQSGGRATRFRQQIFPLTQPGGANYFHANFRFRFRAQGSQSSGRDAFGLDYVYLNANRAPNDTTFQDVATSRGLGSPLAGFAALPAWQYAAAGAGALNPTLGTTVNNLAGSGNPTPIAWTGTVRELPGTSGFGGFGPATWLTGNAPLAAGTRQFAVQGPAGGGGAAPPATATRQRRYRYTLALTTNETNPLTLPNDTTYRDLDLTDYYAYDDGSAEASLSLPAQSTGPLTYYAYGITLAQPDQVRAVLVAPIFNNIPTGQGGENFQNRQVTVAVWADNNGQPAATPLATQQATLTNSAAGSGQYVSVALAQPVAVTGRFYVGFGQASSGRFLPYGFDVNYVGTPPTLFYNAQNTWSTPPLSVPGVVMVRAVMSNNGLALSTAAPAGSPVFGLYPSPAAPGSEVRVSGPAFARAALLDVLGRPVWLQPAAEAGRPRLTLPTGLAPGLYLVRLTLADGAVATRRLVVE